MAGTGQTLAGFPVLRQSARSGRRTLTPVSRRPTVRVRPQSSWKPDTRPSIRGPPEHVAEDSWVRIGVWNLQGRWDERHLAHLDAMRCDIVLLTEVSERVEIPGMHLHPTTGLMAAKRRWAAVATRAQRSGWMTPTARPPWWRSTACASAPPYCRGAPAALVIPGSGQPPQRRLLPPWRALWRRVLRSGEATGTMRCRVASGAALKVAGVSFARPLTVLVCTRHLRVPASDRRPVEHRPHRDPGDLASARRGAPPSVRRWVAPLRSRRVRRGGGLTPLRWTSPCPERRHPT